jgi:putative peptide zinc metalloprotease protein
LIVSGACILWAAILVCANREEIATSFTAALRWESLFVAWLALSVVTALHECAHGLTCKHHGGEVHEIGFLLLFLLPCFYCNVSDAWLFRETAYSTRGG